MHTLKILQLMLQSEFDNFKTLCNKLLKNGKFFNEGDAIAPNATSQLLHCLL